MLATSKSCGKILFFLINTTNQDNFTSYSMMNECLVAVSFELWMM